MADVSTVEDALVGLLTQTVYPVGLSQPSILGSPCRIYRGWPNNQTLSSDLSNAVINLTVAGDNDSGRTSTRYLPRFNVSSARPGVSLSAVQGQIIVSGAPADGDVAGVVVDGAAFTYRIEAGDTTAMVAARLASAIQAIRPALVAGSVLTVPGSHTLVARCVADAAASLEVRRQEKDFRIVAWCPTPESRDAVCTALDAALSKITFLALPDTTSARLQYRNTMTYDQAQSALLYRRDLLYSIEYPTIGTFSQPAMLFGDSDLNGNTTIG